MKSNPVPLLPEPLFGTMGWAYEDWRGPFYSRDVRTERMLEQYSQVFSAVELDTTFYGTPRKSTLTQWAAQVPSHFRFAAKVPRAITHERCLFGAMEAALDFARILQQGLEDRLGALLLQLPPDFTATDWPILEAFLDEVHSSRHGFLLPWVVEFRHNSWEAATYPAELTARNIAIATTDRSDLKTPLRYVRLLGIENSVARFDEKQFDRSDELNVWADRLRATDTTPFVFVRNFYEGHAPETIFALMRRLNRNVPTPPGQQQMTLF